MQRVLGQSLPYIWPCRSGLSASTKSASATIAGADRCLTNACRQSLCSHIFDKEGNIGRVSETLFLTQSIGIFSPGSKRTQRVYLNSPLKQASIKRCLTVAASKNRLNEQLVRLLEELALIQKARGEPFKARAYKRAAETVMEIQVDVCDVAVLEGRPGIGKNIFAKCKLLEAEGNLDFLQKERDNPVVQLNEVHGIGPKKARELVEKYGITTVADLKKHADAYITSEGALVSKADRPKGAKALLDKTQRVGMKYFDDLVERISRAEMNKFSIALHTVLSKLDFPGQQMEIVGSYRREMQNSGDIDIILTDATGNENLLADFAALLEKEGLIEAFLTRGATKILTIARLPGGKARRMDLMFSPPNEYPFAVLYFTGSAAFNIGTRLRAREFGLSLSEHGLKDAKTSEKVDRGVKEERDIFKILKIAYVAPAARVNSESVVRTSGEASVASSEDSDSANVPSGSGTAETPVKVVG